jgi:hypothetical protein
MKNLALTLTITLVLTGGLMAQDDPFGEVDTLYLDQLTVAAGKEFSINVSLWNDEELGGITLPITYPTDKLEFREVNFAGGRVEYINTKPVNVDEVAGTILIGTVVFHEEYIPPDDGSLFRIKFKVKDDLLPDDVITIDTTSLPPAFLLLSDASATNIIPYFRAGTITVGEKNRAPVFDPIPDIYIAESDSLYISLSAVDPDSDAVTLANPIHPFNSAFIDNGDGTARFAWKPDYLGPVSSEQSPYEFVFWASDGEASTSLPVTVNVINVNRPPQISAPALVQMEAGDSLGIAVAGVDPDFEAIAWEIDGLPDGATFDFDNPGLINWVTQFADSGNYLVTLTATDPYGMADTAQIDIDLTPVTLYALRIDTMSSFSGRVIDIEIFLKNKFEISEFDLLINLDAAILMALAASNDGTRSEHFEYFDYRLNDGGIPGDVRIMGRADIGGPPTGDPIGEGEGTLCRISLQISSNLTYVGNQVPVQFTTRIPGDNTLLGGDGNPVDQQQINLFNGFVLIAAPGQIILGDINLNGLPFEISDVVYFSNFFISPGLFPFNDQQLLNSDINQDGFAPSVADLVLMIQIIAGEVEPPSAKVLPSGTTATVEVVRNEQGLYILTDSPVDIAGAYFRLQGPEVEGVSPSNLTDLDLHSSVRHDRLSCLMISYTGETISNGGVSVLKLSDDPNLDVRLKDMELADVTGRVLEIEKKENAVLPGDFALHQNYPNPFNPSTEIAFDLRTSAWVTLSVYNILGQEIIRMADREFPAGSHSLIWDGTDSNGRTVASGIYLYRIKSGGQSASRKMVLMK